MPKPIIHSVSDDRVTICRERPATVAERARDPEADVMVEWVTITFGADAPVMHVNRNLCGE